MPISHKQKHTGMNDAGQAGGGAPQQAPATPTAIAEHLARLADSIQNETDPDKAINLLAETTDILQ